MKNSLRSTPSRNLETQGWGAVPVLVARSHLQELLEYLSSVQGFINREQHAFIERVEEEIAAQSLEGADLEEYYSFHEDEHDQLHNGFPRIVYSSTLVMACALYEG